MGAAAAAQKLHVDLLLLFLLYYLHAKYTFYVRLQ